MSTSSVKRGRPQNTTACAPNTYQPTPKSASATVRERKSSAKCGGDGTESLSDALVNSHVGETIGGRLAGAPNTPGVPSQLVDPPELLSRREGAAQA